MWESWPLCSGRSWLPSGIDEFFMNFNNIPLLFALVQFEGILYVCIR